MSALWTPDTLARAILWGAFDARRARKVRRHFHEQADLSVQAVLDAVAARTDPATATAIRDGLAKVGVTP